MNPATTISLCTVRLACTSPSGESVGTGYFYSIDLVPGRNAPLIITNKHVVRGAITLKAVFQIAPQEAEVGADGSALGERSLPIEIANLQASIVWHPDDDVDLCAIMIAPLFSQIPQGFVIKHSFVNESWHLTTEEARQLRPIEPILMIGYPNGLWDEQNNRPIARQGTTASHALHLWNGRRQFVIDAACFPGSSGSPVFLFEDGLYRNGTSYTPGTRIKLLGTLWGGPLYSAEGRLESREIPTSVQPVPVINFMMNLGFVVPVSALDEIKAEILRLFNPN